MTVRRSTIPLLILGLLMHFPVWSQDTLPKYTLIRLSDDKVLVEWKNTDTSLRQISIQQSTDSLSGYRTILNILDPRLEQNGTVISRPLAHTMFYRLYLLYPRGRYLFTPPKRPALRPPAVKAAEPPKKLTEIPQITSPKIDPAIPPDVNQREVKPPQVNKLKSDPVPTVIPVVTSQPVAEIKKETETKKPAILASENNKYIPSNRIYTHKDGYPYIELPAEWDLSQVQLRFFTETGQLLFELDQPPIRLFRIDKTNFHRSGWYRFEIWQKGKKMETNRLFIPLEF